MSITPVLKDQRHVEPQSSLARSQGKLVNSLSSIRDAVSKTHTVKSNRRRQLLATICKCAHTCAHTHVHTHSNTPTYAYTAHIHMTVFKLTGMILSYYSNTVAYKARVHSVEGQPNPEPVV